MSLLIVIRVGSSELVYANTFYEQKL